MQITSAQVEEAKSTALAASESQKAEIARALGLEQPVGDPHRLAIWIAVLVVLTAIFFFSAWLTYERSVDDKSLAPFSEFAALVVGGIVGLIAPSPVARGGSGG